MKEIWCSYLLIRFVRTKFIKLEADEINECLNLSDTTTASFGTRMAMYQHSSSSKDKSYQLDELIVEQAIIKITDTDIIEAFRGQTVYAWRSGWCDGSFLRQMVLI